MIRVAAPHRIPALCVLGLCGLLLSIGVSAAERFIHLSASSLVNMLPAHTLTDQVHWSYHFKANGVLDAIDLGETKHGIWRLSGNDLCLDFKQKRKVESDCYEVWLAGNKVRLLRDGVEILEGFLEDN